MRIISKDYWSKYEVEPGMIVLLDTTKYGYAQFVKTVKYIGSYPPENPEGHRYFTLTSEIHFKKRGKKIRILPDCYGCAELISEAQKEQLIRYLESKGYEVSGTENLDTYKDV